MPNARGWNRGAAPIIPVPGGQLGLSALARTTVWTSPQAETVLGAMCFGTTSSSKRRRMPACGQKGGKRGCQSVSQAFEDEELVEAEEESPIDRHPETALPTEPV